MKRSQIAINTKSSNMMVWYLINKQRKTLNIPLAIEVAKITGKRPIDFLSGKIKALALQINPQLGQKYKNGRGKK